MLNEKRLLLNIQFILLHLLVTDKALITFDMIEWVS